MCRLSWASQGASTGPRSNQTHPQGNNGPSTSPLAFTSPLASASHRHVVPQCLPGDEPETVRPVINGMAGPSGRPETGRSEADRGAVVRSLHRNGGCCRKITSGEEDGDGCALLLHPSGGTHGPVARRRRCGSQWRATKCKRTRRSRPWATASIPVRRGKGEDDMVGNGPGPHVGRRGPGVRVGPSALVLGRQLASDRAPGRQDAETVPQQLLFIPGLPENADQRETLLIPGCLGTDIQTAS